MPNRNQTLLVKEAPGLAEVDCRGVMYHEINNVYLQWLFAFHITGSMGLLKSH